MDLSLFLGNDSPTRSFTGPGGVRYMWAVHGSCMSLFDTKTGDIVAQSRWSESGAKRSLIQHLEVKLDALPALNAVVVTFVILEQQRRDSALRLTS